MRIEVKNSRAISMNFKPLKFFKKWDRTTIVVFSLVLFLAVFGCIMVYSASSYMAEVRYGNEFHFLFKQIIGVVLGTLGMLFFTFFPYEKLKKFKWPIVILSAVLLALVFIPGIGIENYGARRWVNLFVISFQPSEIAKFALVIFAAVHLSKNYDKVKKLKGLLPVLAVGAIFALLIILEPNMSITMCVVFILVLMLFVGGISFKHFAMLAVPVALLVPLLIIVEPYRLLRLMAFVDPWASPQGEGFQLIQSLYSLGGGGWFGVGLFASRQKYLFLPFSESDFIFSIIGEELGFIGAGVVLLIFLVLIILLIKIGLNAKDRLGTLLSVGIAGVIGIQTLLNIAVVTGSIPPTGLPLPFISAGSTSVLVFMSAVGIALNVHRRSKVRIQ